MDQITQAISDFGQFPTLIVGIGLLLILLTNFINLVRGITVSLGALSILYYFAIADASQKKEFNNYAKTVTQAITKGEITKNLKNAVNTDGLMRQIEIYKKEIIGK